MKTTLLSALLALFSLTLFGQEPIIAGDTMLCPNGFGTAYIVTDQAYDSYQWQYRFAFTSDPFQNIPNADDATFTYDYYNYSVTEIRVQVTLDGSTYQSNALLIDGYAFLPIFTIQSFDENEVTIDPNNGTLLLCQGASIEFSVGMPYTTNIQWYNNGNPIDGATNTTLIVTQPGNYYVTASPEVCPDSEDTSLPTAVGMNPDCNLSVGNPGAGMAFGFYPNPVKSELQFHSDTTISQVDVYDITGKKLLQAKPNSNTGKIDMGSLSSGVYIMQITSDTQHKNLKFIKD
ncbi:T9SS type A sorting domain-containing protein [Flavobacterium sp. MAH-1]|uniref:T9SS type A sorting domain-containing protein n=1 Tax=Flavobacterium agri TaxID=2743471 RepID=A0A7Y8Y468_9FLAO|nr:T9SS type A sorting domain-containing protein [Flavobacterium agri]NUY82197.1 T9SS type A sorting domain-containing protein [Flavobacterium agri]NYA72221.1 T9SS type A sorting domain-containing protein [Flavobacterium agri]